MDKNGEGPRGSVREASIKTIKEGNGSYVGIGITDKAPSTMDQVRAKWAKAESKRARRSEVSKRTGQKMSAKAQEKQRLAYLCYLGLLALYSDSKKAIRLTAEQFKIKESYVERAIVVGLKNKWHKEVP